MSTPLPKDYAFPKDLPTAAIAAFRKARIAADPSERVDNEEVFADALAAVNYPTESVPPRADMLTPAQRAFAEVVTDLDLRTTDNDIDQQMPRSKAFRRRWLGLDPASAIDKEISFTLEGKKHKEPAWRAALLLNAADEEPDELFEKLPIADRLAMWGAVMISWPEDFDLEADWFFDDGPQGVKTVGGDAGEWAKSHADAFLAAPGKHPGSEIWPIFLALVRAKIPIEPRWDVLLPMLDGGPFDKMVLECIAAIPEDRRANAILAAVKRPHVSEGMRVAASLLRRFPDPRLAQWVLDNIGNTDTPKRLVVNRLKDEARKSPAVLAVITAFEKGKPPPVQLTARDARSPRSGFSDIDKKQLLVAGKAYHGRGVSIDKLLADDSQSEESLLSLLDFCVLADDKGKPVYDVWQYAGDSGEIFKTGTTKSVGGINQGSVECDDEALTDAIGAALHGSSKPGKKAAKAKPKARPKAKVKAKPKSVTAKKAPPKTSKAAKAKRAKPKSSGKR